MRRLRLRHLRRAPAALLPGHFQMLPLPHGYDCGIFIAPIESFVHNHDGLTDAQRP
jgi:hypothetical protein